MVSDAKKKAMLEHNKLVKETLERAKKGETVNLTDLMISKERADDLE